MKVTISTPDGHELQAVHEMCGADRAVLLCHGIASDKEARGKYTSLARQLAERGFDSLRFDFRGHGESNITPAETSVAGMMIDLQTAAEYLGLRYARVHVVAGSFAASVALLLSGHVTLGNLASVCFCNPVTDYGSTFTRSKMPWARSFFPQGGLRDALRACPIAIPERAFAFGWRMVVELFCLSPAASGLGWNVPLLVIHGTDDQAVDPEDSSAFVRKMGRPNVEFVLLDGCSHGLEEKRDEVFERTMNFFERCG